MEFEALDEQRKEADRAAQIRSLLGAVGDNLSSRQSFGNFLLGQMNPESRRVSELADKANNRDAERINTLLASYSDAKKRKDKLADDMALAKYKAGLKKDGGGLNLTPAQKEIDKQAGKQYAEFVAGGGFSSTQKNLEQLREVQTKLGDTDMATGPLVGLLGKDFRSVVLPESADMQEQVEEVVQRNLREVLGAQFTEKEGQKLIERAYNPRLSEEENTRRLGRLIKQIENAAQAKAEAAKYLEEHGTLLGYKGPTPIQTFYAGLEMEDEAPSPNPRPSGGSPFGGREAVASEGPSPGVVEDGYRFKGGDPSDPANWEKVR